MYLLEISFPLAALMLIAILGITLFTIVLLMKPAKDPSVPDKVKSVEVLDSNAQFIDYINQGNASLARYDYDKALSQYQEALKIKNDEPSVHFKIGRVYLQKEDYKNAVASFRNALTLKPDMVESYFELARIYQITKNTQEAHHALNQILTIKSDHEDTLKMKLKLLEQENQFELALPLLQKLSSVSMSPLKYRCTLADYLCKLGQQDDAITEYQALIKLDPNNQLHYQGKIGQAYYDQGQYSQAIEYFKLVLQEEAAIREQEVLMIIKSQLAASLCNEGVKRFQANDFAEAIRYYQEALLYDDANADIHYNMGKALGRTHEISKAIEHFHAAIEINPKDVGSYFEIAVLQDEKGMLKEAQASYLKVLEMDSENVDATFGLGTLFGVQGEMDQAILYLGRAVTLNPEFVDAVYNLGVALERKKDFGKAIKMYKKVIALDPKHEKAYSNLIHVQQTQNQH